MPGLKMADIKLSFKNTADSITGFRFVLDPAENSDRTVFAPLSSVRLKLYPGGWKPQLTVSSGSVSVFGEGYRQSVTEFIVFKSSDTAYLTFPLAELERAEWTGRGDGRPVINGRSVFLPSAQTGVMKVEYVTTYDLVDVTSPDAVYVLISADKDGLSGLYTVDFTDGYDTGVYTRTVILTVKDACTRNTVAGAYVYINGKFAGKSDSDGRARLGSMKAGTYSLKVVKDGYRNTDEDGVCNDYFTVS